MKSQFITYKVRPLIGNKFHGMAYCNIDKEQTMKNCQSIEVG